MRIYQLTTWSFRIQVLATAVILRKRLIELDNVSCLCAPSLLGLAVEELFAGFALIYFLSVVADEMARI